MKKLLIRSMNPTVSLQRFDLAMLFFRIFISLEMLIVHGFKKLGIGVAHAENIPNPLNLPQAFNNAFAISANIFFPFLVLIGFCTRLATLPSLAVTLTGYFVVHWNDTLLEKDTPFIYSVCFLLILLLGPGKYSVDNSITKKIGH
jgi:putative oxidoreductase